MATVPVSMTTQLSLSRLYYIANGKPHGYWNLNTNTRGIAPLLNSWLRARLTKGRRAAMERLRHDCVCLICFGTPPIFSTAGIHQGRVTEVSSV